MLLHSTNENFWFDQSQKYQFLNLLALSTEEQEAQHDNALNDAWDDDDEIVVDGSSGPFAAVQTIATLKTNDDSVKLPPLVGQVQAEAARLLETQQMETTNTKLPLVLPPLAADERITKTKRLPKSSVDTMNDGAGWEDKSFAFQDVNLEDPPLDVSASKFAPPSNNYLLHATTKTIDNESSHQDQLIAAEQSEPPITESSTRQGEYPERDGVLSALKKWVKGALTRPPVDTARVSHSSIVLVKWTSRESVARYAAVIGVWSTGVIGVWNTVVIAVWSIVVAIAIPNIAVIVVTNVSKVLSNIVWNKIIAAIAVWNVYARRNTVQNAVWILVRTVRNTGASWIVRTFVPIISLVVISAN